MNRKAAISSILGKNKTHAAKRILQGKRSSADKGDREYRPIDCTEGEGECFGKLHLRKRKESR